MRVPATAKLKKAINVVKLKIAFAIFLTLCYKTTAASGLTHLFHFACVPHFQALFFFIP